MSQSYDVSLGICRSCELPIIRVGGGRWWHGKLTEEHNQLLAGGSSPTRTALVAYLLAVSVSTQHRSSEHIAPFSEAAVTLMGSHPDDFARLDLDRIPMSHMNVSCRGGLADAGMWEKRESVAKSAKAKPKDRLVVTYPA